MNSQVLTILLLTVGAHLFQPTHQYRLRKREITETHLTTFIVNSCSAEKVNTFIQNLCVHTLQSALSGHFPSLTNHCKTIGSGNSYCDFLNRYTRAEPNVGAKRFVSRRFVRTVHEDNAPFRKQQESNIDRDLVQILIVQRCATMPSKGSMATHLFCNQTLDAIRQGRFPEMKQLCQSHPGSDYCNAVLSFSAFSSRPSSSPSSSFASNAPDSHLTSVPFESSKSSDVESVVDHQRMNKNTNKVPLF